MYESSYNGALGLHLSELRVSATKRSWMQRNAALICVAVLLLLTVSLTACGTPLPVPCEPLPPISPPPLTQPLPQTDYSISVQRRIKTWASELTGTSQTSRP